MIKGAGAASGDPVEVEVVGDTGAVLAECVGQKTDATLRLVQIVVVEVDVEKIDVPGQLDVGQHVGLDDLAGNRQRGCLGHVVDVAIAGAPQLLVFLGQQPRKQRGGKCVASLDTD